MHAAVFVAHGTAEKLVRLVQKHHDRGVAEAPLAGNPEQVATDDVQEQFAGRMLEANFLEGDKRHVAVWIIEKLADLIDQRSPCWNFRGNGRIWPIADVQLMGKNGDMADVVYLDPGAAMPGFGDDGRWLTVEAFSDGLFCGTGSSWKPSGEWVGYGSLAEDDVSLEAALVAAQQWAEKYDVPTIWVQLNA